MNGWTELSSPFLMTFTDFGNNHFTGFLIYVFLLRLFTVSDIFYDGFIDLQTFFYDYLWTIIVDILHYEVKLEHSYYDYAITYFSSYFYVTDQDSEIQTVNTHHHVMQPLSKNSAFAAYKPVARKVKPVPGIFPEDAKVQRRIPEDPLKTLPFLPTHPPDFVPTEKITSERLGLMEINSNGFLWPEEEKLLTHIMMLNERAIAFTDSERGMLRDDYFSPYIIPVVEHIPWIYKNIPIPPGLRDQVMQILRDRMKAGVYEPSQASYRSPWFCVAKKEVGKVRLVHDLQPLNAVTIRDSGLPPKLDEFVEQFAGSSCYTVLDLYSGYDGRKLHPKSRDLTTFQSPLGLLRLTCMPQGFTNSVSEFQNCMTFILKDEIPHVTNVFVDDNPIKGPKTQYLDQEGNPETIPENPGIRKFIWEHAQDVHRILHRIGCAGVTFSGKKMQICRPKVIILGQKCTQEGREPEDAKVDKIKNWPPLKTIRDVRAFLGLCGTMRIWIKDYSMIIRPLTMIWRKNQQFTWDEDKEEAFQKLKELITTAPVLRPIDYSLDNLIVLSVDSSKIGVGFILSQIDEQGKKRPARYGSIPFNDRESNYSQPKLELYGLFRALRAYRYFLYGAKNLHVEVDAKYIKGMLNQPDIQPNATMNRWVQGVLLFHFKLIHIPATQFKGPDALSRREPTQDEVQEVQESDDWLDDIVLYTNQSSQLSHSSLLKFHCLIIDDTPQDKTLHEIKHFLETMTLPQFDSVQTKKRFIQRALQFFIQDELMYRRRKNKMPQRVILNADKRLEILNKAHEELAHRGIHGVFQAIRERFYWPHLHQDVEQHIRSCHECQIRSVKKVEIPLTISTPAALFTKIYVDVMLMPKAHGFRYIVAARDDLSLASEGRALRQASAANLAKFFWEEIICRYGAIAQVVTDNEPEVKGAFEELLRRYGIPQIHISAYNSKANGVVERGHFIIREGIIKSCKGNLNQWPSKVPHAFFADKCIIRRSTGFSPYYLLHAVDPVLPFDLTESTFLVQGFKTGMSSEELLALRIQQLEKHQDDIDQAADMIRRSRLQSKENFEKHFQYRITNQVYKPGTLVLVRNSQIEKELSKKSKPRYLGPYEIVRQTKGGSYIIKELDGAISRRGVAQFRIIPYVARDKKSIQKFLLEEFEQFEDAETHEQDEQDAIERDEEEDL